MRLLSNACFNDFFSFIIYLSQLTRAAPVIKTARYHILGAGSIGCLWAAALAKAGQSVTAIVRDDAVATSSSKSPSPSQAPIILESNQGTIKSLVDITTAGQVTKLDTLLVCVKSYQLEQALLAVAHSVTQHSDIVLLQNGMGHLETARTIIPNGRVWLATNTHGAYLKEPLHCVHAGHGETLIGQATTESGTGTDNFITALDRALPSVKVSNDINHILWSKLAVNAVINPLTAVHQVNNGALLENNQLKQQAEDLIEEMAPVFSHYAPKLSKNSIRHNIFKVAQQTSANNSSMKQDMANKKETEIDAITGYLLAAASKIGIGLPAHQQLYQRIKRT
ncbi:MAG: ketopantoate reductase family protein [Kangiellaceae bacterium]|jgi:2-dehydropantoate 2-reductase|nr:ketopantoate reductase family protein [Kangiellaceae bacterium]